MKKYPLFIQLESADCGPSCLRMVAKYYGRTYSAQKLREMSFNNRNGSSLAGISEAAEQIGFKTIMAKLSFDRLKKEAPLPVIVFWQQRHFVVVYEVTRKHVIMADPAIGTIRCTHQEFKEGWINGEIGGVRIGVSLLLEPTQQFYQSMDQDKEKEKWDFSFILSYLQPHYRLLGQIMLGMLIGSFLQLLFPLLTQSIVDKGISANNIGFVNLILVAQLVLLFSRMVMEFVQSRVFLFMGTRVGISILSDFLVKLMKLPVSFFEARAHGDILQRMSDSGRIQSFLTGTTLGIVFSVFNLFLFGWILLLYSSKLFAVYFIGSVLHAFWIVLFLKKQREMNFKLFDTASSNQNILIQLISGIQEIKLHNSERKHRWKWETIQAKSYNLSIKNLNFNQYQQAGSFFINETKNIIITYLTVTSVMNGEITLGMMLSAQYIIGQLNGPVYSLIGLTTTLQEVKISVERLGEIYDREDEEKEVNRVLPIPFSSQSILLKNVTFQYGGPHSPEVLKDITLEIPEGKTTAIVGASGSGKSTLMKLLLRFYEPVSGEVAVGAIKLKSVGQHYWRERCGAVIQDGYIFSDTIAQNIIMGDETPDPGRLEYACQVANIQEFIESLPLHYYTKIGPDGVGLSQGQKQRLLIARAVYKNPEYLFLDEATNALDANNERAIVENLRSFFKARTVVIIAHRLSTVMDADKIVVLENGRIVEEGNHLELVSEKGMYYTLVKNQLELGQ